MNSKGERNHARETSYYCDRCEIGLHPGCFLAYHRTSGNASSSETSVCTNRGRPIVIELKGTEAAIIDQNEFIIGAENTEGL